MSSRNRRNSQRKKVTEADNYSDDEIIREKDDSDDDFSTTKKPNAKRSRTSTKTKDFAAHMEQDFLDELSRSQNSLPMEPVSLKTSYAAGIIKKIDMENFMCHRRYSVDLGKNLNFISGKNGSGKSAVATAIQVCLGATARTTGRGANLSTFIREGSDRPAVVRITLWNEGADAFEPEKYGKQITVERTINRSGLAGGYVIYDTNGKEVSRQRSDLENMLRSFNIYVDNPCCVLTQEESKKFINGKESEKYEFFLKATGLANLRDDILLAANNITFTEKGALEHQNSLAEKKANVDELKKIYDRLEHLDSMEQQIKLCQGKLSWVEHHAALEEADKVEKIVDNKKQSLAKAKKELEERSTGGSDYEEQLKEIEGQINEIEESMKSITDEIGKFSQQEKDVVRTGSTLKSRLDQHRRTLKDYEERHKKVTDEIKELQQRAMENAQSNERALLEKRDLVTKKLEGYQQDDRALREEKDSVAQELQDGQSHHSQLQQNITSLTHQIGRLRDEITNLSESGQNKAAALGRGFPALMQRIAKHRFHGPVFGPIGVCLTMNDGYSQWSKALERSIGAHLRSFVVTTTEDAKMVRQLAKDVIQQQLTVIIQPNLPRYNVPTIENPQVVSVLQTLSISDDLVFNCLVDQAAIERVILVQREDDIIRHHIQRSMNGVDELKYHATSAITVDGTLVKYTNGNQSSEVNRYPHLNILAQDKQSLIQTAVQNLETRQQEKVTAEEALRAAQQTVRPLQQKLQDIDRRITAANNEIKRLQREKQRVDLEIHELNEINSVDITPYEAEKEELRIAIEKMHDEIKEMQGSIETQAKELQQVRRNKGEKEKQKQGYYNRMQELAEKSQSIAAERSAIQRKFELYQRRMRDVEQDLLKEEEKLLQLQAAVTEKEQQAIVLCQETIQDWTPEMTQIERRETRESIMRKMKELKADIVEGRKEAREKGYTFAVIKERYQRAVEDYETIEKVYKTLLAEVEDAKVNILNRQKKFTATLKHCTHEVKKRFDMYAQSKNSSGSVEFDHKACKLKIQFQVDNSDKQSVANDVRNLSGGERSFVTFAFQLALGHVIESPFRLLDEYDIFMDEITRKLTLDVLQEYANRPDQRFRQFIILTPHRLAEVVPSDFVRILYVSDPVRHTAGGLQQQTLD